MLARPRTILTDIEGTTTPIPFVHDVLFPYARTRLPDFMDRHANDPAVMEALNQVGLLDCSKPPLQTLLAWMDEDSKATPLKTLQGLIWAEGYASGALKGRMFKDVPAILERWHAEGIALYVYSSGSEAAQRLIFGHAEAGDLARLFFGFFDTRIGAKRDPASYVAIAMRTGCRAAEFLFLSDIEAELDAAAIAGMATCQLVRPEDGTIASQRHPTAPDFITLDRQLA